MHPDPLANWEQLVSAAPSPLQELDWELAQQHGLRIVVKRDDQLRLEAFPGDQAFGGNKWRKLKYNLLAAREQGYRQLLTFGGAYSNHLAATASAGYLFGLATHGIVRGEPNWPLNPTLAHCQRCGMTLEYWDRQRFRTKDQPKVVAGLKARFAEAYVLPEGGTNALALLGCAELAGELHQQGTIDYLILACGTGGTLAGLVAPTAGWAQLLGVAVLKGNFLQQAVTDLLAPDRYPHWQVLNSYHAGGYAKCPPAVAAALARAAALGLPLEPIYTAKTWLGLEDLVQKNFFRSGSTIALIHTGGLQGYRASLG